MKGKAKAGYIAVRVFEAVHWIGAALCLFMAVWVLLEPDWFSGLYKPTGEVMSSRLVQYGYMGGLNMSVTGQAGFNAGLQTLLAVGGAVTMVLGRWSSAVWGRSSGSATAARHSRGPWWTRSGRSAGWSSPIPW